METFSASLALCAGNSLTTASDAELWNLLWSAPEKGSSKQSRRWRFETSSRSLWRHSNGRFHCNTYLVGNGGISLLRFWRDIGQVEADFLWARRQCWRHRLDLKVVLGRRVPPPYRDLTLVVMRHLGAWSRDLGRYNMDHEWLSFNMI